MATPRRSQLRIAYPANFATQSDFTTALSNGAIDALFSLVPDSEPTLEFLDKNEQIIDCTGQFKLDEIVLARSCRLQFDIELDADVLAGLLGWGFGTVSGADRLLLSPTEFQPPVTSFIVGHDDAAGTKLKLKSMVLDEITLTGRVNERVRCQVSFRGHGAPTSAGAYTFPDCSAVTPIRLSDGLFTLDGDARLPDIRSLEFRFSNGLFFDEDPYTADSPDITRMERKDIRDMLFTFTMFGQPGDADHTKAIGKEKVDVSWRIGAADDGVLIAAAQAILRTTGVGHDGEARRSVVNYQAEPIRVGSDGDTPIKATVLS